jgi:RNA polymerase sigma-70 factor (ECF subfamily)
MESTTDEVLIQRIALGDEQAFALLYDRYGKPAYSLAFRILGDGPDAEDVVQEAFLNVWRMARSFDSRRGTARTWILSVIHHRAVDVYRRRRGMVQTNPSQDFQQPMLEVGEVWQEVVGNLNREAISNALNQLPEEQCKVIELAYFAGYTHREIAEIMQMPLGTVKSRIRIGVEKLRNLLKDQDA